MTAEIHTNQRSFSRFDGTQVPSSHSAGVLYTHQNARAKSPAALTTEYGNRNARRANATAPVTPRIATAHGTVQQSPTAAANPPRPNAPVVTVMTRAFSFMWP